jgi:hypothetical protein
VLEPRELEACWLDVLLSLFIELSRLSVVELCCPLPVELPPLPVGPVLLSPPELVRLSLAVELPFSEVLLWLSPVLPEPPRFDLVDASPLAWDEWVVATSLPPSAGTEELEAEEQAASATVPAPNAASAARFNLTVGPTGAGRALRSASTGRLQKGQAGSRARTCRAQPRQGTRWR